MITAILCCILEIMLGWMSLKLVARSATRRITYDGRVLTEQRSGAVVSRSRDSDLTRMVDGTDKVAPRCQVFRKIQLRPFRISLILSVAAKHCLDGIITTFLFNYSSVICVNNTRGNLNYP